jgi:hypothetical protein
MKLHLLLLASLFSLTSGFMAELRGSLTDEVCSDVEYDVFENCVMMATEADLNLPPLEDTSFMIDIGEQRRLQSTNHCGACRGGAPKGHFCMYFCGRRRRLLWEVTDTPDLSRLQEDDDIAVFNDGDYVGNPEAIQVAKDVMQCFENLSTNHPCLGSTDLVLVLHTALTDGASLFKKAGCVRGVRRHRHYQ